MDDSRRRPDQSRQSQGYIQEWYNRSFDILGRVCNLEYHSGISKRKFLVGLLISSSVRFKIKIYVGEACFLTLEGEAGMRKFRDSETTNEVGRAARPLVGRSPLRVKEGGVMK